MVNNFHTANMLAEYSMNLLRGQMISQLMTGQPLQGMSLAEFILGKPAAQARRSGKDMMDDALSGLMRSDAGMLRQASKNMLQGKELLQAGSSAIKSIQEKVARMSEITAHLQNNYVQTEADVLKSEYTDLAASIKSTIEGAQFNGISLLDGAAWASDERVSVSGDTGKISLQAGKAPTELTLYDLQSYKNGFNANDLGQGLDADQDRATLSATADALKQFSTMLSGMGSSYEARAGLLDNEAASFERQADILDEATSRAKPEDEESLKQALVDILMRDTGSLIKGFS